MKKYRIILSISIAFIGSLSIIQAQSNPNRIVCSRTQNIPNLAETYPIECKKNRNAEIIAADIMKTEIQNFQAEILTPLLRSNQNNNLTAQNIIREVRRHKACLQEICFQSFKQCSTTNLELVNTFEEGNWCNETINSIDELNRTIITTIDTRRSARLTRSLLRQKFVSISTRFESYLQHWLNRTVMDMQTFVDKVRQFLAITA